MNSRPSHQNDAQAERFVTVKLIRLRVATREFCRNRLDAFPDLRLEAAVELPQDQDRACRLLLRYRHVSTGMRVSATFDPLNRRAPACIVTMILGSRNGLNNQDVSAVLARLGTHHLSLVALRHEFGPATFINDVLARGNGFFGTARRRIVPGDRENIWFGAVGSPVTARCFQESDGGNYRIDLELNRIWLKNKKVESLTDFCRLPSLVCPAQISFWRVDEERLLTYLSSRSENARTKIEGLRLLQPGVLVALRYMRQMLHIWKPERFLKPYETNEFIVRALKTWAAGWSGDRIGDAAICSPSRGTKV